MLPRALPSCLFFGLLLSAACASTAALTKQASRDMSCPESELTVYEADAGTKGVRGCGLQKTYVETCDSQNKCTWTMDTDPALAPWKSHGVE